MDISSNKDYFQMQTRGMIKFEKPSGLESANGTGAMFKQGYTYYLSGFDPENLNTEFSRPRLCTDNIRLQHDSIPQMQVTVVTQMQTWNRL